MKTVAITGGAGTLGTALTKYFMDVDEDNFFDRIKILSRDERKHEALEKQFPGRGGLSFEICDVRDVDSVIKATRDVDCLIHAAALKRVGNGEVFCEEYMDTNIQGTLNVLEACKENYISEGILVSTDKAVAPANLYGATKLICERLWERHQRENPNASFSIVRYGNVINSNGSVLEVWRDRPDYLLAKISKDCTRFWLPIEKAVKLICFAYKNMNGGEIFIDPSRASSVEDLFKSYEPGQEFYLENSKAFEKLNEELIRKDDQGFVFCHAEKIVLVPRVFAKTFEHWKHYLKCESGEKKIGWLNSREWAARIKPSREMFDDLLGRV